MINLRILRKADYPGLPVWTAVITGVLTRGRKEGQRRQMYCDNRNREICKCYNAGLEDEGKGYEPRDSL